VPRTTTGKTAARDHDRTHDQFTRGLAPAPVPVHPPPPAPRDRTLNIRINVTERAILDRAARERRMEVGPFIRKAALAAAGVQAP